jgi:hypothetical protein
MVAGPLPFHLYIVFSSSSHAFLRAALKKRRRWLRLAFVATNMTGTGLVKTEMMRLSFQQHALLILRFSQPSSVHRLHQWLVVNQEMDCINAVCCSLSLG